MDPFTLAPTLHGKKAHAWPMTGEIPLQAACGQKAWPQDISINMTQPGRSPYLLHNVVPVCDRCFEAVMRAKEALI